MCRSDGAKDSRLAVHAFRPVITNSSASAGARGRAKEVVQQWFHDEHPLDKASALYPEHSKQALAGGGRGRGRKSKRGGKRRKGKP